MSRILAIDLGGTQLRAALCEPGNPVGFDPVGTWPAPKDLKGFRQHVTALVADHGVRLLGIAVPGTVSGTACLWIPNLPYLDGVDLAALFPAVEIGLGHDAQLALLAEATAGAAEGLSDVLLVAIGTGIGSAVLAGSRIVRGSSGSACSFGWACADLDDAGHDRDGWLERHVSGRALDRIGGKVGFRDGFGLVEAARKGNAAAISALVAPTRALGVSLAGAVALLDPQAVVLSGGVAAAADVLVAPVMDAMRRQLPPHLRGVRITAGSFGPNASLTGAAIAGARGLEWDRIR
ncbi:ROK family protein [Mesorhizobium sp. ZC-5]|uniref:ROK family protein n=1 Tax=Mesorhizobium sp. ZC-5 TaxID=2986066 RepID=UPI0021E783BB|nr:ROK family protein [Mesorhizobium sp. ZC-5]MCV3241651.1 ROK family protein [Mesorhizobium sp. ZC-5]